MRVHTYLREPTRLTFERNNVVVAVQNPLLIFSDTIGQLLRVFTIRFV